MNVFIDTEFNGYKGDLMSIALVAEDEKHWFYGVLPLPDKIDPWVAEHVVPKLHFRSKPLEVVRDEMAAWLEQFTDVHLIADWPDDITHFLNLLITGPGFRVGPNRFTMEIRRDIGSDHSAIPHNALHDAFAIRKSWLSMQGKK
jgi:hypothetical protein